MPSSIVLTDLVNPAQPSEILFYRGQRVLVEEELTLVVPIVQVADLPPNPNRGSLRKVYANGKLYSFPTSVLSEKVYLDGPLFLVSMHNADAVELIEVGNAKPNRIKIAATECSVPLAETHRLVLTKIGETYVVA